MIAFLDNTKANVQLLAREMAAELADRYGVARVVFERKANAASPAPPEVLARLAAAALVVPGGSAGVCPPAPPRPGATPLLGFRTRPGRVPRTPPQARRPPQLARPAGVGYAWRGWCVVGEAKSEIYQLVTALAASGAAVLLVSSEIPEVLSLSSRVLVMRKVSAELSPEGAKEEDVLHCAT
jgi:hypothetical protein